MERLLLLSLVWAVILTQKVITVSATECMKRKYSITFNRFGQVTINRTLRCDMYFQWTVSDYCCYDKYDVFQENSYCCYSETYKLVLAVGFICLVLLGCSFSIFLCWIYNLPHYLLYLVTCGKFSLNEWTIKNKNSPYVDPSFYSGEPFWARGAEMQHYPLRPMPPKVFYPAPPPKLKYRWDMAHGELPLFIVASRQFTRNPYSARPQDRHTSTTTPNYHNNNHDSNNNNYQSRKNSLNNVTSDGGGSGGGGKGAQNKGSGGDDSQGNKTQGNTSSNNRRGTASSTRNGRLGADTVGSASSRKSSFDNNVHYNPPQYGPCIDEEDAAQELMDALKFFDEEDRLDTDNSTASGQSKNGNRVEENKSLQTSSMGRRQEIFIISGSGSGGNNPIANCRATGRNGHVLGMDQIRPNTTGSLGTFDQYGNYVSLSQLGMTESQRLKINSRGNPNNPNNLAVYSLPGVHTAGVLTTVQNYHVVSSNLGNPMETILEDDSLDEQSRVEEDFDTPLTSSSSSSTPPNSQAASSTNTPSRAVVRYNSRVTTMQGASGPGPGGGGVGGSIRLEYEGRKGILKRRASSMALGSTTTSFRPVVSSPPVVSNSNSLNHVLGPTPVNRAFVPFNPTLPGSIPTSFCDNNTEQADDKPMRRNSIV